MHLMIRDMILLLKERKISNSYLKVKCEWNYILD